MTHLLPFSLLLSVLALVACTETTSTEPADPIVEAISGKTLSNQNGDIKVGSDGRLSGKVGQNRDIDVAGTWESKGGRFCRTLTEPENLAGTECQAIIQNSDGTITVSSSNGDQTYIIN